MHRISRTSSNHNCSRYMRTCNLHKRNPVVAVALFSHHHSHQNILQAEKNICKKHKLSNSLPMFAWVCSLVICVLVHCVLCFWMLWRFHRTGRMQRDKFSVSFFPLNKTTNTMIMMMMMYLRWRRRQWEVTCTLVVYGFAQTLLLQSILCVCIYVCVGGTLAGYKVHNMHKHIHQ